MTRAAKRLLVLQLCAALAGCVAEPKQEVNYSSTDKPLASWPAAARGSATAGEHHEAAAPRADARDGTPDHAGDDAGNGPRLADAGPASAGRDSAASQPEPAPDASQANSPVRLRFSVLTQVQHMRLTKSDPAFDDDARGPKNMGAIWVSKPSGEFLRSLEVWRLHKQRAENLLAYNSACQCAKPDVTATPTLNAHKLHMVSWDMTDQNGQLVSDGPYTLHVEVSDYDVAKADKLDANAVNAQLSIDFDTRDAPQVVMPEATPYYSDIKLELLAP